MTILWSEQMGNYFTSTLVISWEISNTSLSKFAKPKLTLPTSIHPSRTRESNRIENSQNVEGCNTLTDEDVTFLCSKTKKRVNSTSENYDVMN